MLLVDPRQGSIDLVAPLRAAGLEVEETHLRSGDIAFEGRGEGGTPVYIGIEYKKLGEFVQAVRAERLQHVQLPRMREDFDFSWVLVEGEILYDRTGKLQRRVGHATFAPLAGGMTFAELHKRIFVFQVCGGLHPIFAKDQRTTVKLLEILYRVWTDKDLDEHKSHLGVYAPELESYSDLQAVLMRIPHIGAQVAQSAEKEFGSLWNAVTASVSEWSELTTLHKGKSRRLGVSVAEKIAAFVRGLS